MNNYKKPDTSFWIGRNSDKQLYVHEKIRCVDMVNDELSKGTEKAFALLGYACDEGVRRNQGRVGAAKGPDTIRKMLASLSNHFNDQTSMTDFGNVICDQENLEMTQIITAKKISRLLQNEYFTIILGGGHDLAYAHFNGIKNSFPNKKIGIINLDAHFDLRKTMDKGNSGTPFYQILTENKEVKYLCLGIQKESNNRELYNTAKDYGVQFLHNTEFTLENLKAIKTLINNFASTVDHIYVTVDLDGFTSALAPGVSAPSPMGFSLDIALHTIEVICYTNKLISLDLVELNPIDEE